MSEPDSDAKSVEPETSKPSTVPAADETKLSSEKPAEPSTLSTSTVAELSSFSVLGTFWIVHWRFQSPGEVIWYLLVLKGR